VTSSKTRLDSEGVDARRGGKILAVKELPANNRAVIQVLKSRTLDAVRHDPALRLPFQVISQ
jgi:hypothetical protein